MRRFCQLHPLIITLQQHVIESASGTLPIKRLGPRIATFFLLRRPNGRGAEIDSVEIARGVKGLADHGGDDATGSGGVDDGDFDDFVVDGGWSVGVDVGGGDCGSGGEGATGGARGGGACESEEGRGQHGEGVAVVYVARSGLQIQVQRLSSLNDGRPEMIEERGCDFVQSNQ